MKAGYIPSEPIRALVAEYVSTRDMAERDDFWTQPFSAICAVSEEFGYSERSFRRFLGGEAYAEAMPFSLADRWICKMGKPHLWWDELSDVYYAADLSEPPPELIEKRRKARERMALMRREAMAA